MRNALRPGAGSDSSACRSSTRAGRRGRRVDQRRLAGDGDVLRDRADFEHHVERDELLRADRDALRLERLVAGDLRLQRVGAGRHRRKVVLADIVGDDFARDIRPFVGERDGDTGNDAVRVPHRTSHAASELLRARRHDAGKHEDTST